MDYVVGSVAALISGNVTPNRPKIVRRALTPTKHQPSPNVTPKSEFVDDRSIFLSPSVQKKKAIVKKSPKRIFENPDLDSTGDSEQISSPKADKVKKHLKEDLESEENMKSPKNKKIKSERELGEEVSTPSANDNTPKKKKKRNSTVTEENDIKPQVEDLEMKVTPKKKKKLETTSDSTEQAEVQETKEISTKKKKKKSISEELNKDDVENHKDIEQTKPPPKKKNKKHKKKNIDLLHENTQELETLITDETETQKKKKKKKDKNYVNPNAVTNKDTDSEHESDDEIHSENDEANKEILDTGPAEESSDEEDAPAQRTEKTQKQESNEKTEETVDDEVKRTLFVGNVLFSKKCKKEVKSIFKKYGDIETVRIRTIPVKDGRMTPKLAVIKNELHPERTTVNVYVKFKDVSSIEPALSENNTVLNGCHLRVTRSAVTGVVHDPSCSVFVGNMPFALEDEALRDKFHRCGEIVSVRIIRDKKTNAGKGFGYVNFASRDGVELALAMSEEDLTIKNRIMRVKRCLPGGQRKEQANKKNFHGKPQGKQQFGKGFKPKWQRDEDPKDGVQRRLLHKRKSQEGGEGPPEKRQRNLNQPHKEKKVKKEFVGLTAEKKKKNTYNKGQKKKRALSEILNK